MFPAAHQLQAVFLRQLQRLHGGHGLAHQCRNARPDGLAHHVHRHAAAGVEHTFVPAGRPASITLPTALSSALCRPMSSQAQRMWPWCSTKQLCTAWVALIQRQAGAHGGGEGVHPFRLQRPAAGTRAQGLQLHRAAQRDIVGAAAGHFLRRCAAGRQRVVQVDAAPFSPSAQTAICSTSSAEAIHPSVSSRPSASCGSSSGVHTTRKAGCSLT